MKLWKFLNLRNTLRASKQIAMMAMGIGFTSELHAKVIHSNGLITDYGIVSRRVVTDVGAAYLASTFTGTGATTNINWQQSGTGTGSESTSDTALGTATGSRVAGTQSNPTSPTYRSVATLSYTSSLAITEHGIFTASTAGTLWDRSVFAAINVINGDSIQFTYTLTINSGG